MEKKEFLHQLNTAGILEDWITRLKKETLPLVLWGCGDVAYAVAVYLEKCKIKIDCVLLYMCGGGLRKNEASAIIRC